MRLFQNNGLYPSYRKRFDQLAANAQAFDERRRAFLNDRFGALHFLDPVLNAERNAFFTSGDDDVLQQQWALENGLSGDPSPEVILLAQIEHHRTEVFYNLDPIRFPSAFVRKLPGCVRRSVCWRAAPSGNADLTAYHAVLGNFPSILQSWRDRGCRAEMFFPAVDPVMGEYLDGDRPIDVLFVGGYSRHHTARARMLAEIANLASRYNVVFCLDSSRATRLAEGVLGRLLPLARYRRPKSIADLAQAPVFGRQLYEMIGKAKLVVNGAIDMAGNDRGNMRCFEAMGCGALLLSDAGNYPEGMESGRTMEIYDSPEQAANIASELLQHWPESAEVAARGTAEISRNYSKPLQWKRFVDLVAQL
jgi:hypothetical protein